MKLHEAFGLSNPTKLLEVSSPELITDEMVGIEVELEGLRSSLQFYRNLGSIAPWWDVVDDPSLRNTRGRGGEFVLNSPMFGEDVVNAIMGLAATVPRPELSERTSIHVHLDVRNLSFDQLLRLLTVYLLVEPIMFSLVDEDRKYNPYCVPVSTCPDYLVALGRAITSRSSGVFMSHVAHNRGFKYAALNFLPVSTQGSVEFRHKEGTTNPESIKLWVNAVLALKRFAMASEAPLTIDDIRGIVDNYPSFVKEVFNGVDIPELKEHSYNSIEEVSIMAKSIFNTRYIAERREMAFDFTAPFWSNLPEKIKKGYEPPPITPSLRVRGATGAVPRAIFIDEVETPHTEQWPDEDDFVEPFEEDE